LLFFAAVSVLFPAGCDEILPGLENADSFALYRTEESGVERLAWLVPQGRNIGADPLLLGDLAGNLDGAQYRFDDQASAYLFEGDLREGISSGAVLQLPRFDPGSAMVIDGLGDRPWQQVTLEDSDAWSSFRIYDSGECSVVLDWEADVFMFPSFASAVMGAVDRAFAACDKHVNQRFQRVQDAEIIPLFRAERGELGLDVDTDMVRIRTRYRANSIGGCAPVNLDVEIELGFRRGSDGEITGVVSGVRSEVADFCIAESAVENKVNEMIGAAAPVALAAAVRDRFLLDPRDFMDDADVPACTSDADCDTSWPWGTGHRCKATEGRNECWIQIDVDRVNMRPEGVEFVLFENDEDPQRALFSEPPNGPGFELFLCGPDRFGDVLSRDGVTTNLRPFPFPPNLSIEDICN
jgi:hypothetical protein